MPNFTVHLTKSAVAMMIGLTTFTFVVENYSGFELTFEILIKSAFCCLVGGAAPDIDHKDSIPGVILWCVLLATMTAGFLRIYSIYIDVFLPESNFLGKVLVLCGAMVSIISLSNVIYQSFQARVPHRKILHEIVSTGIFSIVLWILVALLSFLNGDINLMIERSIYIASFQYGVYIHIFLDATSIIKIFLA
jgi:hypothetical protein